jgi:hypothetical protein
MYTALPWALVVLLTSDEQPEAFGVREGVVAKLGQPVFFAEPPASACRAVASAAQVSFQAAELDGSGFVVWRCRPVDNCGGFGDRLAGIFGALGLAMRLGRQFIVSETFISVLSDSPPTQIEWPEFRCVFDQTAFLVCANNSLALQVGDEDLHVIPITPSDQALLNQPVTDSSGHSSRGVVQMTKFGDDVAVINLLNRWCGKVCSQHLARRVANREWLFVHSNRAVAADSFAALVEELHVPENQLDFNKCAFRSLFRYSKEFEASAFHNLFGNNGKQHMGDILELLGKAQTIGLHWRVSDHLISSQNATELVGRRVLRSINKEGKNHQHAYLVVATNCKHCGSFLANSKDLRRRFKHIFVQELQGQVHIDSHDQEPTGSSAAKKKQAQTADRCSTVRQAMRDWALLSMCNTLLCEHSGFCNSAAMVSPKSPFQRGVLLDFDRRPVTRGGICAHRFCG